MNGGQNELGLLKAIGLSRTLEVNDRILIFNLFGLNHEELVDENHLGQDLEEV